jgi:hypothetical protein
VTYLEIYNEKIRDLLLDPNLPQPEEIKIQVEKNVIVDNEVSSNSRGM